MQGSTTQALGATHVERRRRRIHHGTALIDVMADSGEILAHADTHADTHAEVAPAPKPVKRRPKRGHPLRLRQHQPICELELELVDGQPADLFDLAATLPLGPGLIWTVAGKGARCRALAYDTPLRAVLASPVTLSPWMNVAEGFHAIGWNCLGQLLANYPLVLATGDPEAVHQSRVAIRRLRAAFSLFGDHIADAELPALRAGFKAAASALGPARDRHVLLTSLIAEDVADDDTADTTQPGHADLIAHVAAARDTATAAAQEHLGSAPFQHLLVALALWLERGTWRTDATTPLGTLATTILSRRRRKLHRLAKSAGHHDDEALHHLRIEAKKLRYAIGFLQSLFPQHPRQRRHHEKLLSRLQDTLGDLHDIAIAASGHTDLFAGLKPKAAEPLAAAFAAHTAPLAEQRPHLLRRSRKLLAQIADIPPWWKD